MNRDEKKKSKEILVTKERWKVFYRQYSLSVNSAINFGRVDLTRTMMAIENLFAPEKPTRAEKKKVFNIALTFSQYKNFSHSSNQLSNASNKELSKAIKNIKSIHERQKFRNMEIITMMIKRFNLYIEELKDNKSLLKICGIDSQAGHQAKMFRERRLKEAQEFWKELKTIQIAIMRSSFMNDIEHAIRMFIDFFEIAAHRLDVIHKDIHRSIAQHSEELEVKVIARKQKLNLKLPSWELFQDN